MALNAGEVIYKIFGDDAEIKKTLGKLGSVASKSLAGIGAAVTAASAAIGKLAQESIEAYGQYEQLVGGVETLFGAGGASIEEYAKSVGKTVEDIRGEYDSLMNAQETVLGNAANAFKTAGMSANEYMSTVTGFSAALINSMGGDTEAAAVKADMAITDMADNANKMGTAMEDIQHAYQGFAKQNYTMLDNLKLGYGGTKEEMQRLLDKAEEISGFEYDISSYADIVDAIHVIQTEMGITGTTANEAATTIEGSINTMKAAWTNALAGMADPEQDFEKLINDLVDSVVIVEQNLAPRIQAILPQLADGINQIAGEVLPLIPEAVNDLLPDVLEGAEQLLAAILDTLGSLAETGGPVIAQNAKSIIDMLVSSISDNLPSLIQTAAQIVVTIAEAILDEDNVTALSQAAVDILTSLVGAISENIDTLIPAAVRAVLTVADGLINNTDKLLDAAEALIKGLADGLLNSLPELLIRVPAMVVDILAAFADAVPDVIEFAVEFCSNIAEYIANYDWEKVGADMHKAISDAINNALHGDSDYSQKEAEATEERISRYNGLTQKQLGKMMADTQDKLKELENVWQQFISGDIGYEDIPKWMRLIMDNTGQTVEEFFSSQISDTERNLSELTDAYNRAFDPGSYVIPDALPSAKSWNSLSVEEREAASAAAESIEESGEMVLDTLKKISDDEAKALRNKAKIDLANEVISEDQYYNQIEALAGALEEESKLFDTYTLEVANGRKKLREQRAKQDEADRKQAEREAERAAREAENQLKKSVSDKFRDLETQMISEGRTEDWLLDQKRAFIETLDHNTDLYKEYNLTLLKEQEKYNDKALKETEGNAKKQGSALEKLYNSVLKARDTLAQKLSLSGDIFSVSESTDKRTGQKDRDRSIALAEFEKKVEAKKKLAEKIALLYEQDAPDSLISDLLSQDPEDALYFANELLKSPAKLSKLASGISADEFYSKKIADTVTENSKDFEKLGADAGALFGESFAASLLESWDTAFEKIFSDEEYLSKISMGVTSANGSAAVSASAAPRYIYTADEKPSQAAAQSATGAANTASVIKLVDVNWNYVAKGVSAVTETYDRIGGR